MPAGTRTPNCSRSTVPGMSPALLDSVLGAVSLRARPAHHARRSVFVTTALLAGAALAAIGVMQLRESTRDDSAATATPPRSQPRAAPAPSAATDRPASATRSAPNLPVDTTAIEVYIVAGRSDTARLSHRRHRTRPRGQRDVAVRRHRDGRGRERQRRGVDRRCVRRGRGECAGAVEVSAAHRGRQASRLAGSTDGDPFPARPHGRAGATPADTAARERLAATRMPEDFPRPCEIAWERVAADDFRGAELQLDEARALYELDGFQEGIAWDFYAYLYTVQGNYDRAIDAYETGIAAYARAGAPVAGIVVTARESLLRSPPVRPRVANAAEVQGRHQRNAGRASAAIQIADEFIARLAALGVTEATLPPQR